MRNLSILTLLLIISCGQRQEEPVNWKTIEEDLQILLLQAQDGDTINIPEGNFMFKNPLILDGVANVIFQ